MSSHAATKINQKEYLKKYLSGDKEKKKKKKKDKKHKKSATVKIIDDDAYANNDDELDEDLLLGGEDAPIIVAEYIEERPNGASKWKSIAVKDEPLDDTKPIIKQEPADENELWGRKAAGGSQSSNQANNRHSPPIRVRRNSDNSPQRRRRKDSDNSPPRKNRRRSKSKDHSPVRRIKEEPVSPKQKIKREPRSKTPEETSSIRRKQHDAVRDQSPPRRSKRDASSDQSPPRRRQRDVSSDQSPPRRSRHDANSDQSPPRRKARSPSGERHNHRKRHENRRVSADKSPIRRRDERANSDQSPPRRRDPSPRRRQHRDDQTPPLRRRERSRSRSPRRHGEPRKNHNQSPSGRDKSNFSKSSSPPPTRKSRWAKAEPEHSPSPPPTHAKHAKTLDGKKAGLQDAKALKTETAERRRQEEKMFEKMSRDVSGRDAEVQIRSTGRRGQRARDAAAEDPEERRRKEEADKKNKEQYERWGKGLKQIEMQRERQEEMLHEASKPLARYAHDEDLERHLREQEHADDPMLAYIRQKRKQREKDSRVPTKPVYEGSYPENRFGIRPGYRWDGVDRSNGYEQRWFDKQNERRARQDEAYKYSVEDM